MANTKTQKTIQTNNQIEAIHNEWCVDNGYPVKWTRLQAGRPKLNEEAKSKLNETEQSMEIKHPSYYKKLRQARKRASAQADKLNADNSERFVKGARSQADKPASAQASSGSQINKR